MVPIVQAMRAFSANGFLGGRERCFALGSVGVGVVLGYIKGALEGGGEGLSGRIEDGRIIFWRVTGEVLLRVEGLQCHDERYLCQYAALCW